MSEAEKSQDPTKAANVRPSSAKLMQPSQVNRSSAAQSVQKRPESAVNYDVNLFRAINAKSYAEQAQFFLNAFWTDLGPNGDARSKSAEQIWKWWELYTSLDSEKKAKGSHLDEFQAHRFFEKIGQATTVQELRKDLKSTDIEFERKLTFIEALLFQHKYSIKELLSKPQGTSQALEDAKTQLKIVQDEIDKYEAEKARLEEASKLAGVKGNTAKNELAQHLNKDLTKLNEAYYKAQAAVRKAQKEGATAAAGTTWWLDMQLQDAKKYLPQSKQRASKPV